MTQENELQLQKEFLNAILDGNLIDVKTILNQGIEVNFQHPYFDEYKKSMQLKSTFSHAVCSDNPLVLSYLFSQGLVVDKSENVLIFIHNKECLQVAMNHGFQITPTDIEILLDFRPALAATACLNGVKITQEVADLLFIKLTHQSENKLIKELLNEGYKINEKIKSIFAVEIIEFIDMLQEKEKLENSTQSHINHHKIKI